MVSLGLVKLVNNTSEDAFTSLMIVDVLVIFVCDAVRVHVIENIADVDRIGRIAVRGRRDGKSGETRSAVYMRDAIFVDNTLT